MIEFNNFDQEAARKFLDKLEYLTLENCQEVLLFQGFCRVRSYYAKLQTDLNLSTESKPAAFANLSFWNATMGEINNFIYSEREHVISYYREMSIDKNILALREIYPVATMIRSNTNTSVDGQTWENILMHIDSLKYEIMLGDLLKLFALSYESHKTVILNIVRFYQKDPVTATKFTGREKEMISETKLKILGYFPQLQKLSEELNAYRLEKGTYGSWYVWTDKLDEFANEIPEYPIALIG